MRRLGFTLATVAVVAAASWTYHVNYRTKLALERIDRLRGQIAAEREAVGILRVEWAWLNNHERLRRLVELNREHLGLEPMQPQHFGEAAEVPFPPRPPELAQPPGPGQTPPAEMLLASAAGAIEQASSGDDDQFAAAVADAIARVIAESGAAPVSAPDAAAPALAAASMPLPPPRPALRRAGGVEGVSQ